AASTSVRGDCGASGKSSTLRVASAVSHSSVITKSLATRATGTQPADVPEARLSRNCSTVGMASAPRDLDHAEDVMRGRGGGGDAAVGLQRYGGRRPHRLMAAAAG